MQQIQRNNFCIRKVERADASQIFQTYWRQKKILSETKATLVALIKQTSAVVSMRRKFLIVTANNRDSQRAKERALCLSAAAATSVKSIIFVFTYERRALALQPPR